MDDQETLVHSYKYNAVAFVGIFFSVSAFFTAGVYLAPLGLALGLISFFVGRAFWSVPALIIGGFSSMFNLMQIFSGGFLLTH